MAVVVVVVLSFYADDFSLYRLCSRLDYIFSLLRMVCEWVVCVFQQFVKRIRTDIHKCFSFLSVCLRIRQTIWTKKKEENTEIAKRYAYNRINKADSSRSGKQHYLSPSSMLRLPFGMFMIIDAPHITQRLEYTVHIKFVSCYFFSSFLFCCFLVHFFCSRWPFHAFFVSTKSFFVFA